MNFDRKHLTYVDIKNKSFEEFKSFLDSLDEERKTWSLDLQMHKNEMELYKYKKSGALIIRDEDKWGNLSEIIGFVDAYDLSARVDPTIEVSFVVKKEYQGKGLGTRLLKEIELEAKKRGVLISTAKHFKDNIASHKAFLKAGYKEWKEHKNLVWKIKEL